MEIKEINNIFIKIVHSKNKCWITDVYYGTKGVQQKGHMLLNRAPIFEKTL